MENVVHLYSKAEKRGSKSDVVQVPLEDKETLKDLIDDDELYDKLIEDAEILDELLNPLDMERVLSADQSPLFFGSAMTNVSIVTNYFSVTYLLRLSLLAFGLLFFSNLKTDLFREYKPNPNNKVWCTTISR